ncbi:hypothetical protein [Amycolatopsis sp. lyj-23]|uniref:hypothetical protein n=1 Tax=Amycolatopsis sp. lyj-23 TaxID=2789283 RepID=UPI0039789C22
MTFSVDDLKLTISQAQKAIGGNGATYFTDWECVLTEHEALLSAVLSGVNMQECRHLVARLVQLRQANEALYTAQCQFDYACSEALRAL